MGRGTALALGLVAAVALTVVPSAIGGADHLPPTKVKDSKGKFVPLPDGVLGSEDAYIDTRIRADLVWIAKHFPRVYVGEGYAGPLPGGGTAGCLDCHVAKSDHKIGLGVDIYPDGWDGRGCDSAWNQITRLAKLTEPRKDQPQSPFSLGRLRGRREPRLRQSPAPLMGPRRGLQAP